MRDVYRRKSAEQNFRAEQRQKSQSFRQKKRLADPVTTFRQHIQEGPVYTCVSCHRHLYRQSVVELRESRYKPAARRLLVQILAAFSKDSNSSRFICRTCQSYVKQNKIPCQAAINGLQLDDIPEHLHVTELESALIAQRIPFMRIVALPRGRQRAIHGAVVNVPSNVSSTVSALPLTPVQSGLIGLKLKRRLRYKGYVMHQFVRPDAVIRAVNWLVENNQLYCGIPIDNNWTESCLDEDPETWMSVTGAFSPMPESNCQETAVDSPSDVEPSSSSETDTEHDAVEKKVQGLKFSTCLQPTVPEYSATELCIAPAEGQTPLDVMLDKNAEVKCV